MKVSCSISINKYNKGASPYQRQQGNKQTAVLIHTKISVTTHSNAKPSQRTPYTDKPEKTTINASLNIKVDSKSPRHSKPSYVPKSNSPQKPKLAVLYQLSTANNEHQTQPGVGSTPDAPESKTQEIPPPNTNATTVAKTDELGSSVNVSMPDHLLSFMNYLQEERQAFIDLVNQQFREERAVTDLKFKEERAVTDLKFKEERAVTDLKFKEEREAFFGLVERTTTTVTQKTSDLAEVVAAERLIPIVAKLFPALKFQPFEARLYEPKDKYFGEACNTIEVPHQKVEIDLLSFGYASHLLPCPRIDQSSFKKLARTMNCVMVGEATTSSLRYNDAKLLLKCKQLEIRVVFLEAYYKCHVHSAYLMAGKYKLATRNFTKFLRDNQCRRLEELYKDNLFYLYID